MKLRTFNLWIRQVALTPVMRVCTPQLFFLAALWRKLLFRTTFIAITGSVGKTTTKELLADILASRGRTYRSRGNQNNGRAVPLNVLRVRPWHRFAVLEVGIAEPGQMVRSARVIRPDVAIILTNLRTHAKTFKDFDLYAADKAVLLKWMAPGGLAVLNADDIRVAAMSASAETRVRFTGSAPDFHLWIDQVYGRWPERLRFRAHCGEEVYEIQTQLVGCHWAAMLAAALAAARELGVPLADAAAVLRNSKPYTARLEPVVLPHGPIVIRDDYKTTTAGFEASLLVLREAEANRKVLVISNIADGIPHKRWMRQMAEEVSGWVGLLVLIGEDHMYARRRAIEAGMAPDNVHAFGSLKEAADFLRRELRSGDVTLLKGRTTDHIARLYFAQLGTVNCWREHCPKTMLCDSCWELGFHPDSAQNSELVSLRNWR